MAAAVLEQARQAHASHRWDLATEDLAAFADAAACPEQGYLRYLDVLDALATGRLGDAREAARDMQAMAARYDDPTLGAIGLVFEGVATVRSGEVGRGLALCDEAMLSVHAGDVGPNWADNLYCQVMGLCFELADIERARTWTGATERWRDRFSNAAMFSGICRVHRAQLLHLDGDWDRAEARAAQAFALAHDLGRAPASRLVPGGLTDREEEVLVLVAEGASSAAIADRPFACLPRCRRRRRPGGWVMRRGPAAPRARETPAMTTLTSDDRPTDDQPGPAAPPRDAAVTVDEQQREAFLARFGADQAAAMHLSAVVFGDQLGLYRALADGGAQAGAQLADRTGYTPRLVLEWLRGQAVSGYCEHDEATDRFWLTRAQQACLADDGGPTFVAGETSTVSAVHRRQHRPGRRRVPR